MIFMVVAVAAFNGGDNAKFVVVLDIAISTTLLSYLWIFPAVLKLRYTYAGRAAAVPASLGPGRHVGSTVLVTFWIALGSCVAVFPDSLEKLFGVGLRLQGHLGRDRSRSRSDARDALVIVFVGMIG